MYAIERFGQAFEVFPRIISENGGFKAETVIADMYTKTIDNNKMGIDVTDGKVKDVAELGILDCYDTKSWAMKLCVDACLTILKVD